ncbi:MAG: tRNA pseudouridine(38-40) synthase TruA [Chitinophagaceae bacterium]|nr:tRNA pseudouridine(38-40) synthase TruA [Chitinophagaceae bacterium]
MPRYFLEVAYKGTNYSGFQVQENANTIQGEIEKAFNILHGLNALQQGAGQGVRLIGSSRTDAGVHALQNFFHFDTELPLHLRKMNAGQAQFVYKMNAILPADVVIRNIYLMHTDAHCRFDAISREYEYRIHRTKNPFQKGLSYFYPYRLDLGLMQQAASFIQSQTNFFFFSKAHTQVKNFNCTIKNSAWIYKGERLVYNIEANRFLRGMVRLLTAAMLQVGRKKISMEQYMNLFSASPVQMRYSVPAEGLFLKAVKFRQAYFQG